MAIRSRGWRARTSIGSDNDVIAERPGVTFRCQPHEIASNFTPLPWQGGSPYTLLAAISGNWHGSHSHRRRQQAERHHSDLGREKCRAALDDRGPAVRTDADSR